MEGILCWKCTLGGTISFISISMLFYLLLRVIKVLEPALFDIELYKADILFSNPLLPSELVLVDPD